MTGTEIPEFASAEDELAWYKEQFVRSRDLVRLRDDVFHYANVWKNHRRVEAEGAKFWHYLYISPADAWYDRSALIGLAVSRAYWLEPEPSYMSPQQPAYAYAFAFKVVKDVVINPNGAYTIVYVGGDEDRLISYDTLCVQLPRRMRDWGIGKKPESTVAGPIVG
jgi:hypothetical protein